MIPRKDSFWFWLMVLIIVLFWGLALDAQPYLSSDDMGKDLYPFEMTLKGRWPCRDYYWQYGPLMLFYYAFWLGVGGVNLLSIRIGYSVLYLLSSILSYRMLRPFVSSPIAFLVSLSFFIQGMVYPYYNFNHIGAIPLLLTSLSFLWKFFIDGRTRWVYGGMLTLIGMSLVKWNVGVISFLAFVVSLFLFKKLPKKQDWVFLFLIFGSAVLGTYLLQYSGCRSNWVEECLSLTGTGRVDPWLSFKHLIQWFLVWDRKRLGWLGLFLAFGIMGFLGWKKSGWEPERKKVWLSVLGSLFFFGLFNSSDYFTWGHIYRLDFWSFPILALGMALAAELARPLFGYKARIALAGLIFVGVLALPIQSLKEAFAQRVPARYLDFPRGKVYVVKETLSTVETIKKTTHFILEHTRPEQAILNLPKEPLYCFLSGRRHAVWELDFELNNQLPGSEKEEEEMIRQIDAQQVPLVLISNRDESNPVADPRLKAGQFGKTHYPKLGDYIFKNYKEVETFGTWETGRPRLFHAMKIYRRKD